MSIIANNLLQGDEGYNISRSLRFRSSASAYLNRTPAGAGNRKTWTWSCWAKRGALGIDSRLFGAGTSNSDRALIQFETYIGVVATNGGSNVLVLNTTPFYSDPAAWYHVVIAIDTTQATASNRAKVYVNGVQVTSFTASTYPSQNTDLQINSTNPHVIGTRGTYSVDSNYDGLLTEMNFVDGQQLTPSSFGETDLVTGVWKPKKYAGTYGTNGFYLDFKDNSSTAALGYDAAGSNDWTVNNISLTAGTTYDSMVDVPTMSALASNYAVWNPLQTRTAAPTTYSNGNLRVQFSDTGIYQLAFGTIGIKSNKYYWEVTVAGTGTQGFIGIADISSSALDVPSVQRVYANNGEKGNYSSLTSYGASYTAGDVIGVAVDADSGTITFYKNNTSQGTAFTDIVSAMPSGGWTAFAYGYNGTDLSINFGQRPFSYTPPTGFVALNTFNLPEPSIKAGNKHFDATTYTGNGTGQSIVNSGAMQPDLVWLKSRSAAYNHGLIDGVRGITKHLFSNLTNAEATCSAGKGITALNSNGFTLGTESDTSAPTNENGTTFVGWQWKAGNSAGSSNTAGSITSTVSANPTAGFSVVTYTGNGTSGATVGHGLGVAPRMVILKRRDGTEAWPVYHASLPSAAYYLRLNGTDAQDTATSFMNNTAPSSSVFTLGNGGFSNTNTWTYVAYCFAEVAGYSKFGSYTGNGSSDGTFVHLGFRPKFILTKRTNTSGDWFIWDTVRNTYNAANLTIWPNYSSAEYDYGGVWDILSNGFKARTNSVIANNSGDTYIYMAFAENPFKYSLAR